MLWIIPASVISCIATFLLGYYLRGLKKKIEQVEKAVQTKITKKEPIIQEPKSEVLDPLDEVQTAIYERDQMLKKMNPE